MNMQINLIDFLKQENAFLKKQVEHLNKQNARLMEMLEASNKPKKEKEDAIEPIPDYPILDDITAFQMR